MNEEETRTVKITLDKQMWKGIEDFANSSGVSLEETLTDLICVGQRVMSLFSVLYLLEKRASKASKG